MSTEAGRFRELQKWRAERTVHLRKSRSSGLVAVAAASAALVIPSRAVGGEWRDAPAMNMPRDRAATCVTGGVIVVGGGDTSADASLNEYSNTVESYLPGEVWKKAAPFVTGRAMLTCETLPSTGSAVFVGGLRSKFADTVHSDEVDVGNADGWGVSSLNAGRFGHAQACILDACLVTGGYLLDTGITDGAELYQSGAWVSAGSMPGGPRAYHSMTALADGKSILVVGGHLPSSPTGTVDIFDVPSKTWRSAAPLIQPRGAHTATRLTDGRVLVAGGIANLTVLSACEVYDPATDSWTRVGSLATPRYRHSAVLAGDGAAWVVGGSDNWDQGARGALGSVERFGSATATWGTMPSLHQSRWQLMLASLNGQLYAMGGQSASAVLSSVEVLDLPSRDLTSPHPSPVSSARGCACQSATPGTIASLPSEISAVAAILFLVERRRRGVGRCWPCGRP